MAAYVDYGHRSDGLPITWLTDSAAELKTVGRKSETPSAPWINDIADPYLTFCGRRFAFPPYRAKNTA